MRCTWLLLLLAAPLARAQCADGAPPVCSDGTDAAPPGDGLPCASGAPSCADGTTLSAPGGDAPAGGGTSSGGTGSTTATGCSPTTCTADGLSNYVQRSYTYGADGKITGTIKTNNCITHSVSSGSSGTFSCEEQTFPDPSYASTPAAIPLLGRAGMSLAGGNNIYSMFEAGFGSGTQPKPCGGTAGNAMSGTYGECDGGLSVELCELHLAAICPGEERTELMLDQCGGHASPYHFHADLVCEYDLTTGTHSRATGAALDGHIIYGKYETGTTAPVDLDVCNGHTGAVPADSDYGFTSGTVYHYHMTDAFPHTIGCYGPVADEAACRALYPSECNGDYTPTAVAVAGETLTYNVELYCPCTYPAGDTAVVTSPPPPVAASPSSAGTPSDGDGCASFASIFCDGGIMMMTHHYASSCAAGTNTSGVHPVASMPGLVLCEEVDGGSPVGIIDRRLLTSSGVYASRECIGGVPMMKMYDTENCTGEGLAQEPLPFETCLNMCDSDSDSQSPPRSTTLLHLATEAGRTATVEALLAAGVNFNIQDTDGKTALYMSCEKGHTTIAIALLAAGANVTMPAENGAAPLHMAAQNGHITIVEALLAAGADLNMQASGGSTPLHLAAGGGHILIVEKLLAAGAGANIPNENGKTAIQLAFIGGHKVIVEALLSAGAGAIDASSPSPPPPSLPSHAGIAYTAVPATATLTDALMCDLSGSYYSSTMTLASCRTSCDSASSCAGFSWGVYVASPPSPPPSPSPPPPPPPSPPSPFVAIVDRRRALLAHDEPAVDGVYGMCNYMYTTPTNSSTHTNYPTTGGCYAKDGFTAPSPPPPPLPPSPHDESGYTPVPATANLTDSMMCDGYGLLSYSTATVANCRSSCDSTSGCAGFSWFLTSIPVPVDRRRALLTHEVDWEYGRCYLMTSTPTSSSYYSSYYGKAACYAKDVIDIIDRRRSL